MNRLFVMAAIAMPFIGYAPTSTKLLTLLSLSGYGHESGVRYIPRLHADGKFIADRVRKEA